MVRYIAVLVGLMAAAPALAGEMTAEEARHFVVGHMFSYSCFEGTRGQGRVLADGGVVGSIQFQGAGQMHYAALPAGTLKVEGQSVCASLRGLPIEPCFNLEKINDNSFRGSVSGLSFMYCEFTRNHGRPHIVHHRAHRETPLALRPSLAAENN